MGEIWIVIKAMAHKAKRNPSMKREWRKALLEISQTYRMVKIGMSFTGNAKVKSRGDSGDSEGFVGASGSPSSGLKFGGIVVVVIANLKEIQVVFKWISWTIASVGITWTGLAEGNNSM